jgi:hypothetical protein
MFVTTRIANGIVALLALCISIMLLFGGGFAMRVASIGLALVPLFFLGDIIFRRKNSSGDMIFTTVWTLFFLGGLFSLVVKMLSRGTFPPLEIGGPLLIIMYGLPLLLNTIYLFRLLKQKKIPA